jgi:hypothetical protein
LQNHHFSTVPNFVPTREKSSAYLFAGEGSGNAACFT